MSECTAFRKKKAGGAVCFIPLLVLGLLFTACGENETAQNIQSIEYRLGRLDQKLQRMESNKQQTGSPPALMQRFEEQLKALEESEKQLAAEIRKLDQQLDLLQKMVSKPAVAAVQKASSGRPGKKVSTIQARKTAVHVVQSGETLYRIAGRYGMSLAELRRLNGLAKNQFIFPGQKLKVFAKSP